jgi:hypothetical protein
MPNHKPATETAVPLSPQLLAEARSDTARTWASQALPSRWRTSGSPST